MAGYKRVDMSPQLLPVDLEAQLVPGGESQLRNGIFYGLNGHVIHDARPRLSRTIFWRRPGHIIGAQLLVKEFWREIRTARPDDSVKFSVQHEFRKVNLILEGLEYVSPQFAFKINLAFDSI